MHNVNCEPDTLQYLVLMIFVIEVHSSIFHFNPYAVHVSNSTTNTMNARIIVALNVVITCLTIMNAKSMYAAIAEAMSTKHSDVIDYIMTVKESRNVKQQH